MAEISKAQVNFLIVLMILTGAANTLVYKLQNTTMVTYKNSEETKFNHPFMQAISMFIGEGLCFLLFIYARRQEDYKSQLIEAQAQGKKTKLNYAWLLVPAIADLCTSTLQYIALNYISPSIYQMIRGGVVVVTAMFSRYFLKIKQKNYQIFGCFLVCVGIGIVGVSNFAFKESSDKDQASPKIQAIAMGLILISLITNGVLFVSEEKLFDIYFMHPFQVVGTEGSWGVLAYLLLLPLLTFIQCPKSISENSCVAYDGNYYFERPDVYFYEIFHQPLLLFWVILGVFTIAAFNISGVSVTKYVSSVARSVVDVSRTVLVWLVGLIVSFINKDAHWENTGAVAIVVELLGFAILVFGNLIYNRIIVFQFLEPQKDVSDLQVSLRENSTQETPDQ